MKRQRKPFSSDSCSYTSDSSLSQSATSSQTENSRSPSPVESSRKRAAGNEKTERSRHLGKTQHEKTVNGRRITSSYKNVKDRVYSPARQANEPVNREDRKREKRTDRKTHKHYDGNSLSHLRSSNVSRHVSNNPYNPVQDKSSYSNKHGRYRGETDKNMGNVEKEESEKRKDKQKSTSTHDNKSNEQRCVNDSSENSSQRRRMRCYRDRRDSSGSSSGDRYNNARNASRMQNRVSENAIMSSTRKHNSSADRKVGAKSSSQQSPIRTESTGQRKHDSFDSSPEPLRNRRSRKLQLKISAQPHFNKTPSSSSSLEKGQVANLSKSSLTKGALQNMENENSIKATAIVAKFSKSDIQPSTNQQGMELTSGNGDQTTNTIDTKGACEKIEQAMQMRTERIQKWKRHHKPKSTKDSLLTRLDTPSTTENIAAVDDDSDHKDGDLSNDEISFHNCGSNLVESPIKSDNLNEETINLEDGQTELIKKELDESEEDPLDEYMSIISQQVKELKQSDAKKNKKAQSSSNANFQENRATSDQKQKTVIVRTTISGSTRKTIKGDIMEQNADALEYSSEEYSDDDVFANKRSKADTINTDHNKIYYRKFKKCFYSEVPEIANMTAEEVALLRIELDNIHVTGKRCPKPIKSWAQCLTYLSILDTLKRCGMHTPTPIQSQALPIIASGRDMLGIAKTGSGKTLAFLLPMFRHIKAQPPLDPEDGPIAIIITPTRELAMQIAIECKRYCRILDLRVVAVFGGTGISEQIADLKRGTEIVVCTPGRMIDMLAANNGKVTNLRRVTYVVIDEADRMFDMGFEPQVNKILECIRPDRQTVMFSATFPRQMEALARRALHKPIEVVVGGKSVVCDSVEQQVFVLYDDQKYLKLLELLGMYQEHGSVLVFVHKQEHADELMKNLLHSSYSCMALHGGIDQYDRDSVLSDFKSGALRLLIATSLAARGLDVKELILVVNYDCPNHYEDYVHRCGRTGRAGRSGVAATFITPNQEKLAGDVIRALELANNEVPDELRQLWNSYKSKMQEQGVINIKSGTGGFGGKGFRFDSEEQAFLDDRKRVQKLMFNASGRQDYSDDEEAVDIDSEIDKTMKSKTRIKNQEDIDDLLSCAGESASKVLKDEKGDNSKASSGKFNAEKLAFAKLLASRIGASSGRSDVNELLSSKRQNCGPNSSFSNFTPNDDSIQLSHARSSKSLAEQIAGKLNNKLNYIPKEKDLDGCGLTGEPGQQTDVKVYEEQLEINDFPQSARWKVTSKETLANIAEYAEAAVTVRGKYFPSGKQPPPGESRLYLIIESLTERGLQLAKTEIKRLIKEEMMKMQNPALQMVNRGRYKVL